MSSSKHPASHGHDGGKKPRAGASLAKHLETFPYKLFDMLEQTATNPDYDEVVSWSEDGRSFIIGNRNIMMEDVVPKFFNQTKFRSFSRQLNLWGFTRNESTWSNPNFIRGEIHKLVFIERIEIKSSQHPPKQQSTSNRRGGSNSKTTEEKKVKDTKKKKSAAIAVSKKASSPPSKIDTADIIISSTSNKELYNTNWLAKMKQPSKAQVDTWAEAANVNNQKQWNQSIIGELKKKEEKKQQLLSEVDAEYYEWTGANNINNQNQWMIEELKKKTTNTKTNTTHSNKLPPAKLSKVDAEYYAYIAQSTNNEQPNNNMSSQQVVVGSATSTYHPQMALTTSPNYSMATMDKLGEGGLKAGLTVLKDTQERWGTLNKNPNTRGKSPSDIIDYPQDMSYLAAAASRLLPPNNNHELSSGSDESEESDEDDELGAYIYQSSIVERGGNTTTTNHPPPAAPRVTNTNHNLKPASSDDSDSDDDSDEEELGARIYQFSQTATRLRTQVEVATDQQRQQKTEQKASFPIVHSATNPPQPNHHRLSPTQQSVAEIASNEYAKGLMFFNAKRKREEEGEEEEEEETSSSDVANAPLAQDASARDNTSPPPPKRLARKYYCKHPGCTNKRVKGGVCKRHEAEAYTYTCSIEGCTNDVIQDGVCMNHYSASVDTINELNQGGVLSAVECLLGLSRSNPKEVSTGADIRGPTASTDPVYNYNVRAIMKSSAIAVASPSVTKSGHKRYYCKANGCTNQVQKLGMCKRHGSEANKRHTYSYDGCNLTPEEASLVNIIIQDDNAPIEVITHRKVQDIMKQRKGRWIREEEDYADHLCCEFAMGLADIDEGSTKRSFLSNKLKCSLMRISKKFRGQSGKEVFIRKATDPDENEFSQEDIAWNKQQHEKLERIFIRATLSSMMNAGKVRVAKKYTKQGVSQHPAVSAKHLQDEISSSDESDLLPPIMPSMAIKKRKAQPVVAKKDPSSIEGLKDVPSRTSYADTDQRRPRSASFAKAA